MKDGDNMKRIVVIFAWEDIYQGSFGMHHILAEEMESDQYEKAYMIGIQTARDAIPDLCLEMYKDIYLSENDIDDEFTTDDIPMDNFDLQCLIDDSTYYSIYRQHDNSLITIDEISNLIDKYKFELKKQEIFLNNFSVWQKPL